MRREAEQIGVTEIREWTVVLCLGTHKKPHYTIASVALYRAWVGGSSTYVVRFPPKKGVVV